MNLSFTRFLFLLLLSLPYLMPAQTSLSGIINNYFTIEFIDYCNSSITLTDANGFNVGDAAILIQTQGASIYEERDGNFGRVTDIANAGKYEQILISAIQGNTISLENPLINTYALDGGTQLVSFPSFADAEVTAALAAQAWNGSIGGVLALEVTGTLTLNAPISVAESGFRGGIGSSPDNPCTGGFNNASAVYYQIGDWRGAAKGEGIAAFIPNKENGRGPQANGGGGGNDHNSGGAGGSHVTIGGDGGNRDTPFLTGFCKGDNPGIKGYSLPEDETRLYFGGGGGAGHSNNATVDINGGNGGGIILLKASIIIANGQTITATGGTPEDVSADGAAGGGAGGTIALLTDNIVGDLNLDIRGGNGANAMSDGSANCFGPGGGGSGGRVLTNSTTVNIITDGGTAGLSLNNGTASCNNTTNGAEDGQNGRQLPISRLEQSNGLLGAPEILFQPNEITACTTQDALIEIEAQGAGVSYQWQIDSGNGFQDLFESQVYEGTQSAKLSIKNLTENMNGNQFRLLIQTACFDDVISAVIPLTIIEGMLPEVSFEYDVQPGGVVLFTNTSTNGDSFIWGFNGGVMSNMTNASFVYPAEGEYPVTLTVTNECGFVSITETVNVIFEPTAAFSANVPEGCTPYIVDYINSSSDNAAEFMWIFEGGTPTTSTEQNPSITYETGGIFDVQLVAINSVGTDTLLLEDYVSIASTPIIEFNLTTSGLEVITDNITVNANTYEWDFGDGNTSTEINPRHSYAELGTYVITLFASNECGETSLQKEIAVGATPLALFSSDIRKDCKDFSVQFIDLSQGIVNQWAWMFPGGDPSTSEDPNPIIKYTVPGVYDVQLTVFNELDQDGVLIEDYIEVGLPPIPDFSFLIDGKTAIFTNLSSESTSYAWNFGDGTISTEENPVHSFAENGLYFVTLNAYNDFCGVSVTQPVSVAVSSTTTIDEHTKLTIAPNPASDFIQLALDSPQQQSAQIRITDIHGKLLFNQWQDNLQQYRLDVSAFASGLYLVQINAADWQIVEKVIVE